MGGISPEENDYVIGRTRRIGRNSDRDMANPIFNSIAVNGPPLIAILSASATLDFPNTTAQLSADLTITVNGARTGDCVIVGVPNGSVNANSAFTAWVSADDTVTVRFNNYSAGAINPASGVFNVIVFRLGG